MTFVPHQPVTFMGAALLAAYNSVKPRERADEQHHEIFLGTTICRN
jgi:hypothetical protein